LRHGRLRPLTGECGAPPCKVETPATRAVWERCVSVPAGVICQDEAGRLWDVLFLLALAARRNEGAEIRFGVHVRNDNRNRTPPLVRLKAVCGPGDHGKPVVTVMLPDED
jgi:hypothetical protein